MLQTFIYIDFVKMSFSDASEDLQMTCSSQSEKIRVDPLITIFLKIILSMFKVDGNLKKKIKYLNIKFRLYGMKNEFVTALIPWVNLNASFDLMNPWYLIFIIRGRESLCLVHWKIHETRFELLIKMLSLRALFYNLKCLHGQAWLR